MTRAAWYALGALAVAGVAIYWLDHRGGVGKYGTPLQAATVATTNALGVLSPLFPLSLDPSQAQLLRDKPVKV